MTSREYLAFRDDNDNLWVIEKYGLNLEVRIQNGKTWAVRINHDWHGERDLPIEVLDFIHTRGL